MPLKPDDIRIDIGRMEGGSFIRVLHVPTGISRSKGPLVGDEAKDLASTFVAEIEDEIAAKGLLEHIVEKVEFPPTPPRKLP